MITEKDILHKEYLDICGNTTIKGLEEYDIKKLLYNETFYAINSNRKNVIKTHISELIFDLESHIQIDIQRKNDEMVLLSTKWNRPDHDGYWDKICSNFPESTRITFLGRKSGTRKSLKNFSLKYMFYNIKEARKINRQLKSIKNKTHRLFLVNRLLKLKKLNEFLKETNLNSKVAMCFFDSGFFENLAMQFFKNNGAITVTNQHGQPVFKSWDYDRMNQSQILNFKCDYFLAKGEFTRKQFINAGFKAEQVVVIDSFNNITGYQGHYDTKKVFCTFLNFVALPNAYEVNRKLLEMSAKLSDRLGYQFYIKLHPSDSAENYRAFSHSGLLKIVGKDVTIGELAEQIDFGIINESAVYLDLLGYKVRTYRWDNGAILPLVEDTDSIFLELEALENKVNKWMVLPDLQKDKYFEDISVYYNGRGNACHNIQRFIREILMK